MAADANYALVDAELSGATDFNKSNAVTEIKKYHFTVFHGSFKVGNASDAWSEVSNVWKSSGQYEQITQLLGYRFRLISTTLPDTLLQGGPFNLTIIMINDGWARIMNPRKVEILQSWAAPPPRTKVECNRFN